ncbi:hypothetical protein D3C87_959600 [compost metagenome]
MFQNSLLRHVETGGFRTVGQRFISLEQLAVLAHIGGVGAQGWQARLVGFAQFGAVAHGVEVADRAPGSTEAIIKFVHRQYQAGPSRVLNLSLEDFGNGGAVVGQDRFDGGQDVFGTDRGERWQVVGLQQRVVHAHGWHLGWGNIAPS